jgi:AraC-like DNA-binding protein
MILLDQAGAGAGGARLFQPEPACEPFVEHFWTQQSDSTPIGRTWRIIPELNANLIFVVSREGSRLQARCTLVGPRSRFADVAMDNRIVTCGARLRPGALPHLTGLPSSDFTDQSVPVEAVFGARGGLLIEQLSELRSFPRALDILANFLKGVSNGRAHAASLPLDGNRVEELAARAGLPLRTLHFRLIQEIGLAPKRILRIQRLHRSLALSQDRSSGWAQVAASSGFADQAHMTREFVELLGEPPTVWRRRSALPISSRQRTATQNIVSRVR